MPPVLELGGLLISTARLALLVSAIIAVFATGWLARRADLDRLRLDRTCEHGFIAGVICARIAFVLQHWAIYRAHPLSALYLWQPGYTLWAGIAGGGAYMLAVVWRHRQTPRRTRLRILAKGVLPAVALYLLAVSTLGMWAPPGVLQTGDKAPRLFLTDLSGHPVSLAALRGQPVVLNIWATWCVPCREEIPLLSRTFERLKAQGLMIVGVDLAERARTVRRFLRVVPTSYPIWIDPPDSTPQYSPSRGLFRQVGGVAVPTTLFIDRQGVIRSVYVGQLTPAALETEVAKLDATQESIADAHARPSPPTELRRMAAPLHAIEIERRS